MSPSPPLPGAARLWVIYAVAMATFLPAIGFHYVGEEAIFPLSSLEMWQRGDWVEQTIYGARVQHPPLFNWLIMMVAGAVGWEHMLAVARAITLLATGLTGLVLGWLAFTLYADRALAAFAGLVYLTLADVFFYRGWLAYVDPLFALFVAASIAALWVACERRNAAWLWVAAPLLAAAVLSKALTAFVFYGLAAGVLAATDRDRRAFLLAPAAWLAHAAVLALPLAWFYGVPSAGGHGSRGVADILSKLSFVGFGDYLVKLVAYPAETALRLAPALLIAVYYLWRREAALGTAAGRHACAALGIAAANFAPYWLAPQSATRYLLPIFPFIALAIAWVIWRAGGSAVAVAQRWIAAVVVLKLVAVGLFPFYQEHYRGANYAVVARAIQARTAGHPLYAANDTATGLSVTAHLDLLRLPAPPLVFPPARWDAGFVIAYRPDPAVGRVVERYRFGGTDLYLLCRGPACGSAAGDQPSAAGSQ